MESNIKDNFEVNKFQIPLEQIILISPEELEKIQNEINDNNSFKILNINVGILGHVDSGKTSLSKIISSISSTASFDKNPQSKERGITLDLGFSALYIQTPKILKEKFSSNKKIVQSEYIQITLVDCPGHASLIRTVISGASIIDTVILVIDSVKGIQIQTVECIALSEILCQKITIALSKIDLLKNKEDDISKKTEKLKQIFAKTKFGNDISIIPTTTIEKDKNNIENMIKLLIKSVIECIEFNNIEDNEINNKNDSLIAYIDHFFKIKNKGTVATGTIMKGNIKINDEIYFPELSNKYMVKEIQIFRKSVKSATKGDRVGLLIKNLDNQKVERTIITSVGSKEVNYLKDGVLLLKKVNLYKDKLKSNNKYYLMIGNQGISAKCLFFNYLNDNKKEELFIKYDIDNIKKTEICDKNIFYNKEFQYLEEINEYYFAYVKFDKKIIVPNKMIFLGTNIDIDISENKKDRLAFYGKIIFSNNDINEVIKDLKIIKNKMKEGRIIRVIPEDKKICIVRGFIKKENMGNINNLIGKEIFGKIENEEKEENKIEDDKTNKIIGKILSSFGQVGKLKVEFNQEIDIKIFKNIKLEMPIKKYIKLDKI